MTTIISETILIASFNSVIVWQLLEEIGVRRDISGDGGGGALAVSREQLFDSFISSGIANKTQR